MCPVVKMVPIDDDESMYENCYETDSPYCECGNDPYEEEAASGKCASCGKELI